MGSPHRSSYGQGGSSQYGLLADQRLWVPAGGEHEVIALRTGMRPAQYPVRHLLQTSIHIHEGITTYDKVDAFLSFPFRIIAHLGAS